MLPRPFSNIIYQVNECNTCRSSFAPTLNLIFSETGIGTKLCQQFGRKFEKSPFSNNVLGTGYQNGFVKLAVLAMRKLRYTYSRCHSVQFYSIIIVLSPKLDKIDTFEPRLDKTNKMSVRPAKTQISLGIRPV